MTPASQIVSRLRNCREAAGFSQLELARRAGVSRQALTAIEAGRQVPSTSLSLHLARVLGCRVEDLFQLAAAEALPVTLAPAEEEPGPSRRGRRVSIAKINGRWVGHRLSDNGFGIANAVIAHEGNGNGPTMVMPLGDVAQLERNVIVVGCAPLLDTLAHRARHRYRDSQVTWLPANSRRALELLDLGFVHVAGVHFSSEAVDNVTAVAKRLPQRRLLLANLTQWRQGFVVSRGNPLSLHEVDDLLRPKIRFAARESGAGAAMLVQARLGLKAAAKLGRTPGLQVNSHAAVAQLVRCGAADVGVAIEGVALAEGLDFVPLATESFDLVVPMELAVQSHVAEVVDVLGDVALRAEIAHLPGYDSVAMGHSTTIGPG